MAFSDAKQFKLGTPGAAVTFREGAGTTVHALTHADLERLWVTLSPHMGQGDANVQGTPATSTRVSKLTALVDYREVRGLRKALRKFAGQQAPVVSYEQEQGLATFHALVEIEAALKAFKASTNGTPDLSILRARVVALIAGGGSCPSGGRHTC